MDITPVHHPILLLWGRLGLATLEALSKKEGIEQSKVADNAGEPPPQPPAAFVPDLDALLVDLEVCEAVATLCSF